MERLNNMSGSKRILHSQQISDIFQVGEQARFKFSKNSDACTVLIFLLFRFHFVGELMAFSEKRINVIHFIIGSAGTILPVLYMMLFIGHYSKLGCLVLSRIVPLLHGIGYTMLIISALHALVDVGIASDLLQFLYLACAGHKPMPWMECEKIWGDDCLGFKEMENCRKENATCFSDYKQFSVYYYRMYKLKQFFNKTNQNSTVNDTPGFQFWLMLDGRRVIFLLGVILLLLLVADLSMPSKTRIFKTFLIVYVFLCTLLILRYIFTHNIKIKSIETSMLKNTAKCLVEANSWTDTMLFLIKNFSLSCVFVVLIGSYLSKKAMADLVGLVAWMGTMALYMLGEFVTMLMRSELAYRVNTKHYKINWSGNDYALMTTHFPQYFGSFETGRQLVSCCYYSVAIGFSLLRARLILAAMYHTLADAKPIICFYRLYIRIFSCVALFILCFAMCVYNMSQFLISIIRSLEVCLGTLVLLMVTICVLYVYGIQTLCDDHHFTYGSQPVIMLKLLLFAAPIAFILIGSYLFLEISSLHYVEKKLSVLFCVAFVFAIVPQLIGLLCKATYYLKRQNMTHLLRYEDTWGDPNPNTRKDRIIYQPRKETHYFRRIEVCNHECLRYNALCPIIVKEEETVHNQGYKMLNIQEEHPEYFEKIRRR